MPSDQSMKIGIVLAVALSIGLTSIGPSPAYAGPSKPHPIPTVAAGEQVTDISAARKKRRYVRRNDGGAAAAAAFVGIVGTIGAIAAAQSRRDYYGRNYYYGRPHYYGGPQPYGYGYYNNPGYGYYGY